MKFERGQLKALFGASSVSGWGMAPSKMPLQPDSLDFDFAKMVHCGFIHVVFIFLHKLVEPLTDDSLESFKLNGFARPFDIDVIRDYIKSLKHDQGRPFAQQMSGRMFKATIGTGSTVVCPPGWIICEKTMLGNCIGTRIVFQTAQTDTLSSCNALRPKPFPVIEYPARLIGVDFHK